MGKNKDAAAHLTWSQFSTLWWARAHLQLLVQAETQKEVIDMGTMHCRFLMLSEISSTEGARVAKAYDARTWSAFAQKCVLRDKSVNAKALARVDPAELAKVKAEVAGRERTEKKKEESAQSGSYGVGGKWKRSWNDWSKGEWSKKSGGRSGPWWKKQAQSTEEEAK